MLKYPNRAVKQFLKSVPEEMTVVEIKLWLPAQYAHVLPQHQNSLITDLNLHCILILYTGIFNLYTVKTFSKQFFVHYI